MHFVQPSSGQINFQLNHQSTAVLAHVKYYEELQAETAAFVRKKCNLYQIFMRHNSVTYLMHLTILHSSEED